MISKPKLSSFLMVYITDNFACLILFIQKLKKECKRVVDEESSAGNNFCDSTSALIELAKSLSLTD